MRVCVQLRRVDFPQLVKGGLAAAIQSLTRANLFLAASESRNRKISVLNPHPSHHPSSITSKQNHKDNVELGWLIP